jgi:hypothetical protein
MYPVQRKTRNLKVVYFVKKDFNLDYRGRRKLERSIEEEYVNTLEYFCLEEKYTRKYAWMYCIPGGDIMQ